MDICWEKILLTEVPFGELLFTPMIVFVGIAVLLTVATRILLPASLVQKLVWKRSWLNLSLFTCYLALSMRLFGA